MTLGTLYGIGIGPGDPDLITVKGAQLLGRCRHLFVPKARQAADSVALGIVRKHLHPGTAIREVFFPMVTDAEELATHWQESARQVAAVLEQGEDACFITLGDAFLYSTYIYLVRTLRRLLPGAIIVTVPGITAFSAVAAATEFPVGEGKMPVTIVPAADDLNTVDRALAGPGTVVLMKIGKRLEAVLDLLERHRALDASVFVAHAGMSNEMVETDLGTLRGRGDGFGYLSTILVSAERGGKS
jgi:precorrin-2/cobalt-factor-2 C20-methyltransferase